MTSITKKTLNKEKEKKEKDKKIINNKINKNIIKKNKNNTTITHKIKKYKLKIRSKILRVIRYKRSFFM